MHGTFKRWIALGLAGILAVSAGCGSGRKALGREDLDRPVTAKAYEVTTRDGRSLTFISLHLEGELLRGTQRITESTMVGEGDARRTQVSNRYEESSIPWSDVERVEAVGVPKGGSSMILAGGALAVGIAAFLLLNSDSNNTPADGGGGKGF
jgi:hypothetical protein